MCALSEEEEREPMARELEVLLKRFTVGLPGGDTCTLQGEFSAGFELTV